MGQTLTNGLFLPDEGERNCYSGLESNWRALDAVIGGYNTHIANLDIHVTAADKTGWNGHVANGDIHVTAADKTGWNNHVGNSDIHVTAADKQTWDAVTTKANDADVMHKSGDETAAGIKTFSDDTYFKSLNFTNEVASQSSSSSAILPLLTTITYRDATPSATARFNLRITAAGEKSLYPHENNQYSFGLASRRLKEIHAYSLKVSTDINGLNPGALSMPDLTAGVDISGYFTTGTTENTYTPTVNGWVCVHGISSGTSGIFVENSKGFYASANSMVAFTDTDRYVNLCFPVIGGEAYNIVLKSVNTSIAAKFFPCQGNV